MGKVVLSNSDKCHVNIYKNISLKALQWVDRLEDMARHHEERSHGALKTQEENLATHQKVQAWESYVVLRISVHHRTFLYTINDRAPPSDNCGNVSKKNYPHGKVRS